MMCTHFFPSLTPFFFFFQVVDFKLFTPGKALKPDTLWIVEQIPGLVVGGDVTNILMESHFPSYK